MIKYQCPLCSNIYDPDEGDLDSGVEAGTQYEDLPEDYSCPACFTEKEEFVPTF